MMHDMGKVQCDMHLQLRYAIYLWNYSFFCGSTFIGDMVLILAKLLYV